MVAEFPLAYPRPPSGLINLSSIVENGCQQAAVFACQSNAGSGRGNNFCQFVHFSLTFTSNSGWFANDGALNRA